MQVTGQKQTKDRDHETEPAGEASIVSLKGRGTKVQSVENRCVDGFWACSRNCEKRLLASSCLSVRPSARTEQLGFNWKALIS